jgi:hypothetical protein
VDAEVRVREVDGQILCGFVLAVDPVADVGHLGQRLEAVQEPGRDVEVHQVLVVEPRGHPAPEGGRLGPGVHDDVVDRAERAAHQLRLACPAPPVQTAHDSPVRTGLGVLHESFRPKPSSMGDSDVERTGEETTRISVRGRFEDQNALQTRITHHHEESP